MIETNSGPVNVAVPGYGSIEMQKLSQRSRNVYENKGKCMVTKVPILECVTKQSYFRFSIPLCL
jgi:hypothetical protein